MQMLTRIIILGILFCAASEHTVMAQSSGLPPMPSFPPLPGSSGPGEAGKEPPTPFSNIQLPSMPSVQQIAKDNNLSSSSMPANPQPQPFSNIHTPSLPQMPALNGAGSASVAAPSVPSLPPLPGDTADLTPPSMPALPSSGLPPLPGEKSDANSVQTTPSLPTPLSGLPPLPGQAVKDHTAPSTAGLKPLPKYSGASLLDKALGPQGIKTVMPAEAIEHRHVKHAHKKYAVAALHKSSAKWNAHSKGGLFYRDERLKEPLYSKSYATRNRHLPHAYYEQEYDALAFVTVRRDDINGLRALLNTGRSPNMASPNGDSLLITAVRSNAINAARMLLGRHANPNAQDNGGMTALSIAKQMNNFPMQRALEEVGAASMQVSSVQ